MKNIKKTKELVIYQAKSGAIEFRGDFTHETIWATLDQIAYLFGRDKSVISRHFKSIYKEGELDEKSTVAKNATVQIEGNRKVKRIIEYYNLDAIIDVVSVLTNSVQPEGYIKDMRRRDPELSKGWGQIATPLSVETRRGIQKLNCASLQGIFRIIQSIPFCINNA